jgi:hypothetical protein
MLGELALAALIAGSEPASTPRPAIHDTVYIVTSTPPAAQRTKGARIAGTVVGLGFAVGGAALLLHGSDDRHYSLAYDSLGRPQVDRGFNGEMAIGLAGMLGGIAIVLMQ